MSLATSPAVESVNVTLVRRVYAARGAPELWRQIFSPDVVFEITPGFPYGGTYVGFDSVLREFFGRLFADFELNVHAAEYIDARDRIIVLGRYVGRARTTGKPAQAQLVHVWTSRDGRIVRLQQCADPVALWQALA